MRSVYVRISVWGPSLDTSGPACTRVLRGARADDEGYDDDLGVPRPLQVAQELRVEAVGHARADDEPALVTGAREEARQVEGHADARDALARRTAAEAVAPFGDIPLHEKQGGILEELPRKIEEQREQRV